MFPGGAAGNDDQDVVGVRVFGKRLVEGRLGWRAIRSDPVGRKDSDRCSVLTFVVREELAKRPGPNGKV